MRFVALLAVILSITVVATHVSAQTPDDPTVTPEPTELAAPSVMPTITPTPVVAGPNEIVFTGGLPLPVGTQLRALFHDIASSDPIECGATTIPPVGPNSGLPQFVLSIDATCAEGKVGPRICWSDHGCYVHLADRRDCSFFDGCPWSITVAPGKVVDVGYIPVASDGDIAFVGQIPAPDDTRVVLKVGSIDTLTWSPCDSTTSVNFDGSNVSTFILTAYRECLTEGEFPYITFCWTETLCDSYSEQTIVGNSLAPGVTIGVGSLRDHSGEPTPLPHVPSVGGYQAGRNPVDPTWLAIVLGALFAAAIAFGAAGLSLKRFRP